MSINLPIIFLALLVLASRDAALGGFIANQTINFQVVSETEIEISRPLMTSDGFSSDQERGDSTSLILRGGGPTWKITGENNDPLPNGVTLKLNVLSSSLGNSEEVVLPAHDANLVAYGSGDNPGQQSALAITYNLLANAGVQAAIPPGNQVLLTFTE